MDRNFPHHRRQARAIAISEPMSEQKTWFLSKCLTAIVASFVVLEAASAIHRLIAAAP